MADISIMKIKKENFPFALNDFSEFIHRVKAIYHTEGDIYMHTNVQASRKVQGGYRELVEAKPGCVLDVLHSSVKTRQLIAVYLADGLPVLCVAPI